LSQTVELPPQPSAWQLFTAFHSRAQRWPGALRAALALFLPGAVALLTGHGSEMLLIAAGGCVVIYGEGHPYRSRLRVMAIAGLCLVAGVMSGSFVGSVVHSEIASGDSNLWLLLIALFYHDAGYRRRLYPKRTAPATTRFILHCDGLRRYHNGRPPWLQPG